VDVFEVKDVVTSVALATVYQAFAVVWALFMSTTKLRFHSKMLLFLLRHSIISQIEAGNPQKRRWKSESGFRLPR
jgi:hypothetical protein